MFAALCAAVGSQALESANIVGYNTKAVDAAKFYILGPQFEATDGTADINKIISGVTGVSQDENPSTFTTLAPHIQVPNAMGAYDKYYYLTDGYYDSGKVDGSGDPIYEQKAGWCDSDGVIAGDDVAGVDGVLPAGVAIWIKDVQAAESFQQAGQVPVDSEVIQTVPTTFVLRTYPFPTEFNLNDTNKVVFTGLAGVSQDEDSNFTQHAPHIQVPNAAGAYDMYYYLTDGYYATGEVDGAGDPIYDQKAGWCDSDGVIAGDEVAGVTGIVPVGQGFWAKGVGSAFSVTFKK